MTNEPLDRCVCNGLPGFLFEDRPGNDRRVAIGCPVCGTSTDSFPVDQVEDAILAWEAGEFADGAPSIFGETRAPEARRGWLRRPRFLVPARPRT